MNHLRYVKAIAVAVAILALSSSFPTPAKADMSFGVSYSTLSPYGSWVVSAEYGRVWRPRVAVAGWNPYYDGHWVYTDYGWTWVSDYSWGAIPYHYGTWIIEPGLGWVWIPGDVWAPSWVVFCSGPDYIGWAPVPPRYSVGVSVGFGDIGYDRFVVVPTRQFLSPSIRGYVVPQSRTRVIINQTKIVNKITVRNNVVVNSGPDVSVVERASGRKVRAVPIERVDRVAPGRHVDRDQLRIDRSKGGRPRAAEPVSSKSSPPRVNSGRNLVEKRRTDYRQRPEPPRTATWQRQRDYPDRAPTARGGSPRDGRRPEASAVPARRKAPVRQQQPPSKQRAKRPNPKDRT